MLKLKQWALVACASLLLTSCGDEITDVVKENVDALNAQDITRVMSTIDTHSEIYTTTKAEVENLIKRYDLEFEIEEVKIIKAPREEVSTAQEAEKKQEAIKEEDLAFITESERNEAERKKQEEEAAKVNRPYEAEVKVVQVTRSKSAPSGRKFPFVNNKVTVVHTLRKYPTDENPAWKIYKSKVEAAQFMLSKN